MLASIEIWRQMGGGQCGTSSFDLGHQFEHHTKRSQVFPVLVGYRPQNLIKQVLGGMNPTNS